MGEVYKAKDTRLDRIVAVKVLPPGLAAGPELKARFEREARAISALSHPNICALYDVGSEAGVEYLVMEFLDGETLADRLAKGPLAPEQVVRTGIEISGALEAAHRQGIVHRDLKPGNVMLTKSGVKLLDFGLAKVVERGWSEGPGEGGLSSLPTEGAQEKPLTERGTVLGTFQYMSPEQLEGKEADARSDIFALGCVLYEMASGRRAFTGGSRASLIGAILRDQPAPISSIQPMTPPALDRLVQTCLAKDPDDRFQTAHDVKLQLRWIAEAGSQAGSPAVVVSRRKSRERLAWAAAAVLTAVALVAMLFRRPAAVPRVVRSSIDLPSGLTVVKEDASLALSPDGRVLAIAASDSEGKHRIYLRELDSLVIAPLPGTEGASYPFWSPDGKSMGFFAGGKLKRIEVAGGAVQTICDAPQGRGATWGPDGTIVFAPNVYGSLQRVAASGGSAVSAEPTIAGETVSHRDPHFLPGGRSVLYYSVVGWSLKDASIHLLDLASQKDRLVVRAPSEAYYVSPGYLAFLLQRNVMIQPFDPKSGRLSGEAVPIAEKVEYNSFRGIGEFCFAGSDLFAYQTERTAPLSQLTWFDLDGKTVSAVGDPAAYGDGGLAVAPGGKTAAVQIESPEGINIWLIDLVRGVRTRFTFDVDSATNPVWSPDGTRLVYTASIAGTPIVSVKATDGGSPAQTIYSGKNFINPTSWSPDGSAVTFFVQSDQTKSFDVGILPMTGDHKPRLIVAGPANEQYSAFSPDGKWLAYISDESGKDEVYVIPYPGPGGKWQISSGGAAAFSWTGPGEISYIAPERRVFAVDLQPRGSGLEIGAARSVFGKTPFPYGGADYSPAVKRILATVPVGETQHTPITLVTNWAAGLHASP
jgi:Tol biopolymer transport system component